MNDIPDFNLLDLDDSVFTVQEVIFNDENELFHLNTFVDDFMDKNPTAKSDGVFRVSITSLMWLHTMCVCLNSDPVFLCICSHHAG